jgi:hypothetical protein
LFPENVGVKENRKILLCKTSGGDSKICEIKNKNAARGGLWRLMRSAEGKLGFAELVDLCGQDEIALCQTVDLVRPGRDLDFPPGKEDVWMVPLLLCKLAHAVYELEGFAKVGKLETPRDVVFFDDLPTVHLLFERGEILSLKRRQTAKAWDTGFSCQV